MSRADQRRSHLGYVQTGLALERREMERRTYTDYSVGLTFPQQQALDRLTHAVTLLEKAPAGHAWHASRLARAVQAADRLLELV